MLPTTPGRLVVRVMQDVLKRESFACLGDLSEAVKCRCARLRIPYDCVLVGEALDQLSKGGKVELLGQPRRAEAQGVKPDNYGDPSREASKLLVSQLLARYRAS